MTVKMIGKVAEAASIDLCCFLAPNVSALSRLDRQIPVGT